LRKALQERQRILADGDHVAMLSAEKLVRDQAVKKLK